MEKILIKINQIIKKNGIPFYVKKWESKLKQKTIEKKNKEIENVILNSPNQINNDICDLLTQYVKYYHHHTFVICNLKLKPKKKITKRKIPPYAKRFQWMKDTFFINKPKPDFYFDEKNKIGRIRFYKFYGSFNQKDDIKDSQKQIKLVKNYLTKYENKLEGLILDFSRHLGGNCWPTLYALQDILYDVPLFCWSNKKKLNSQDKFISISKEPTNGINIKPKMIKLTKDNNKFHVNYPIAIIIGEKTTSSGEILAGSFIGKKNVKSFGQSSSGFLSVNQNFAINENIELVLTANLHFLTNLKSAEKLQPDKITNKPISDAKKWIIQNKKNKLI